MADNIDVTPGSGKTVHTEEIGGVHYCVEKNAFGAHGSVTLVDATHGLPVEIVASMTVPVTFSNTTIDVTNAGAFAVQAAQSGARGR